MTLWNWLSLLGVTGIMSTVISIGIKHIESKSKRAMDTKRKQEDETKKDVELLKMSIQALLRNELLRCYAESMERGYADVVTKDNFNNMYTYYHSLGSNGVMVSIKERFMDLPERRNNYEIK